jgi:hypothetical protein
MTRIIIFEGPDGAGKTTLAKAVALRLGAAYTHHGPYPEISNGVDLAIVYKDSLYDALLRGKDLVLDRCWISETPYGIAFRDGADRLGPHKKALEKWLTKNLLAWGTTVEVFLCLPTWDDVLVNFTRRSGFSEMLDNAAQLHTVYDWYASTLGATTLPVMAINPFDGRDHVEEITYGYA